MSEVGNRLNVQGVEIRGRLADRAGEVLTE